MNIEQAHVYNDQLHATATSLDDAKHPAFIRRYVARSLPGLREHLKETILNVVRENLQPEDHAAFQELFSRVWKIVADQREQIVESKVDLRQKGDLARANKMLATWTVLKSWRRNTSVRFSRCSRMPLPSIKRESNG